MTVSDWLRVWKEGYLGNIKPLTLQLYNSYITNHINPYLGFISLQKLNPHNVQLFYNHLLRSDKSAKTIKNIHGVLHNALEQAVKLGYIKNNPSQACTLPRWEKKEMQILPEDRLSEFLQEIKGHKYEYVYFLALFTGMRQSELLGLTWNEVDFERGSIRVNKQLRKLKGEYFLDTPKHDKTRIIRPANVVMERLQLRKIQQTEDQIKVGTLWSNPWNLVFTNELGNFIAHRTLFNCYKAFVKRMNISHLRFHDLRHTYAVMSIQSGDDIKTIQMNLGHHSAAFTMDVYAHCTDQMKEESAKRMDQYIKRLV
jgi:integrase